MSVARNTIVDYFCQGATMVLALAQTMILFRALGPLEFGALIFIIQANSFCSVFFNFSLSNSNIYFVGKDPGRLGKMNAISAVLTLAIALAVILLLQWIGPWIAEKAQPDAGMRIPNQYLFLAIAMLPISLYYSAWIGLMVGLGAIIPLAIYNLLYTFIQTAGFLAVLVVFDGGIPGFLVVWIAINLCHWLTMWLILRRFGKIWARFSLRDLINVLFFSMRAYLGNAALTLIGKIDWYFSSMLRGLGGMAVYSRASTVFLYGTYGIDALERATYQPVTSARQEEAARIVQRMVRNILLLSIPVALLSLPFARILLRLLYGAEAEPATTPLRIFLLALPFFSCNRALAMFVTNQLGKPHVSSLITWSAVPVAAILLYFLPRHFGFAGLAAATGGTYVFLFVVFMGYFIKKTGLKNPVDYLIPKPEDIRSYKRVLARIAVIRR